MSKQEQINTMAFYVLLDAATRYHQGFYREVSEKNMQVQMDQAGEYAKKNNLNYAKTQQLLRDAKRRGLEFLNKHETFIKVADGMLEPLMGALTPEMRTAIDNTATAYGIVLEKLLQAENTTEFLTVCEMYVQGQFKEMFDNLKKQTNETQTSTPDPNMPVNNPDSPDELPENTSNTPTEPAGTPE